MSQENVDRSRALYEAWDDGDIEEAVAFAAPDFEFVTSGVYPGLDDVYRGHEGFRKFWRDFHEPWESLEFFWDHAEALEAVGLRG